MFSECQRQEIYFLALIDILTHYGVKKRTAQAAKTVKHGAGAEISTVKPDQYARRFLEFVEKIIEWLACRRRRTPLAHLLPLGLTDGRVRQSKNIYFTLTTQQYSTDGLTGFYLKISSVIQCSFTQLVLSRNLVEWHIGGQGCCLFFHCTASEEAQIICLRRAWRLPDGWRDAVGTKLCRSCEEFPDLFLSHSSSATADLIFDHVFSMLTSMRNGYMMRAALLTFAAINVKPIWQASSCGWGTETAFKTEVIFV